MKTSTTILIVIAIAAVAGGVYFFVIRKPKASGPPNPSPSTAHSKSTESPLAFAKNEGKKVLGDILDKYL
jgi:hypothetical protein